MKNFVVISAVLVISLFSLATDVGAQEAPEFKLGFKTLAEQIPEIVGQPLENEHYDRRGDSLQRTTTGLMVWRKADNYTAFTDGCRTWVNGPEGIQERLNDQRFDWETPIPEPKPVITWTRSASIRGADIYDNTLWVTGLVSNEGDAPAYDVEVTARLLDASGAPYRAESATVEYLGQGDTTAYQVTIKNPGAYTNVEVTASAKESSIRDYEELTVGSGTLNKLNDEYGGAIFTYQGSVTNPTDALLKYCKVDVWFLDAQGKIVWVDTAFTNPGELGPKASGSFERRTYAQRFNADIAGITRVETYGWGVE